MTREEAIDCLEGLKIYLKTEHIDQEAVDMAIDALSADAKTKCIARIEIDTEEIVRCIKEEYDITTGWILCSERLPKDDDWVIVTILDERGVTPYRYTDFGWYLEVANCWIIDAERRTDVTAWMPLPKPYKGGDRE